MRPLLALACVGLVVCSACTGSRRRAATPQSEEEISIGKEKELTADIHRQIREQAELINDPVVLGYLYDIGQELVETTEPQPFIYRFSVIRDDTLNAFTIGGGYIYINSETFLQAGDVNELAGLLAHEIAHVRRRHIARRSEGQKVATLMTLAAIALVAMGGDPGLLAVSQGLNVSLQLKYSREHEAESDREGIDYMIEAGYDPYGMSRFFQRILAAYGSAPDEIPAYLYSHPALEERVAAVRVQVERTGGSPGPRREDPRLAEMQGRLAMLLSPPPGGTGLQARAEFDRSATDELRDEARLALCEPRAGEEDAAPCTPDRERARELLEEAAELQPLDPRVALDLADLAEQRGDHEEAVRQLERAFELDPSVPLVQHRLGMAHKELGNHTRAVFFLEQAVAGFRPGSSSRRRAELEIRRLEFPILEVSGLGREGALGVPVVEDGDALSLVFEQGDSIVWWGEISSQFMSRNPKLRVTWKDPSGRSVLDERVRMSARGRVSSTFDSQDAPPGDWTVDVSVARSRIEQRRFALRAAPHTP